MSVCYWTTWRLKYNEFAESHSHWKMQIYNLHDVTYFMAGHQIVAKLCTDYVFIRQFQQWLKHSQFVIHLSIYGELLKTTKSTSLYLVDFPHFSEDEKCLIWLQWLQIRYVPTYCTWNLHCCTSYSTTEALPRPYFNLYDNLSVELSIPISSIPF